MGVSETGSNPADLPPSRDLPGRATAGRRPRRRTVAVGAIVTTALLLVVPSLVPAVGFGILTHEVCGVGRGEATGYFWTPVLLLNSPYLGQAWANLTVQPVLTTETSASNGSSTGIFELVEWNLSATRNVSTLGPGLNNPCIRPVVATASPTLDELGYDLVHPLNWSDANEIENFSAVDPGLGPESGHSVPSVRFYNSFDSGARWYNTSTCGGGAAVSTTTATEYPVEIPFAQNGRTLWVATQFPTNVAYAYRFPANGGAWHTTNSDPGATNLGGGGWAFEYRACG